MRVIAGALAVVFILLGVYLRMPTYEVLPVEAYHVLNSKR